MRAGRECYVPALADAGVSVLACAGKPTGSEGPRTSAGLSVDRVSVLVC